MHSKQTTQIIKRAIMLAEVEKENFGIAKAYGFLVGMLETEFNIKRDNTEVIDG